MNRHNSNIIADWVRDYSDDLYSWALYKTSKVEVAEDLIQETFFSAIKSIDSFQQNSSAKTWLFAILNNKIIDFYRKKSKEASYNMQDYPLTFSASEQSFDDTGHWVEESFITSQHWLDNPDFNAILSNCIQKLPENWSFVIQSKFILDKKANDICKELNITASNYWQLVHRAKVLLKKCIEINWL